MKYGLIGEKLSHSFSPQIHSMLGNSDYNLYEIQRDEIEAFLNKSDFQGVNITIPYKKSVIPYLNHISKEAETIGAINTIVRKNNELYGYNTDFYGVIAMAENAGIDFNGSKVLILGAGGASAAVAAASLFMGASKVRNAVRNPSGSQLMLKKENQVAEYEEFDIIVNATPVGMFPNIYDSPINIKAFPNLKGVLDCVYNPLRTELILNAQNSDIPTGSGLYMLVAQACKAHELFTGETVDIRREKDVYNKIRSQMENIVLCGMPACGKSTIGKILNKKTGRELIDTDTLIEQRYGKDIPSIFADEGEVVFRIKESEVINSIAERHGLIISVGGGAVISETNIKNLKRNGKIYYIDRNLDLLEPGEGRPLSKTKEELLQIYRKRSSIYNSVSDATVKNNGSAEDCAESILSDFRSFCSTDAQSF